MTSRLLNHVRGNVVAYIALMIAVVSGGGGYAVAATTHKTKTHHKKKPTTVVACASSKGGQMYLHTRGKHCVKGRHKVSWAIKGPKGSRGRTGATGAAGAPGAVGPQGPAGPSAAAFGSIGPDGPDSTSGLTAQRNGSTPGSWVILVTNPACAHTRNVMVVSPSSAHSVSEPPEPTGATPAVTSSGSGTTFTAQAGYTVNGSFTPGNYVFNVIVECGAALG